MDSVSKLYEDLISFSDLYDSASFEAKKMIVNQLIRRVDVYREYQLNITFNFDLTPYIEGDDAAAHKNRLQKKEKHHTSCEVQCFFGGEYRDRTGDLLHAMQALSQLS